MGLCFSFHALSMSCYSSISFTPNMPLQRIRLSQALKKLHLKAPSFRESFQSPRSTVVFEDPKSDGDDDDEAVGSSKPSSIPGDVGRGFFAVYVGDECKRYVIPLNYLKHRVFAALLDRAEEEFGFCNMGAVRFPCETVLFEHILWLMNREDPALHNLEMEELLMFYQ